MIQFLKRCRLYLAFLIILFAVLVSLIRALTPWVSHHQVAIARYLSTLIGYKVEIGSVETGWYWLEPVIKVHNLTLLQGQQPVMAANQLIIGLNLLSSLWHWQIQPGVFYLDKVHLKIHQYDDHWGIEGFSDKTSDFNLSSQSVSAIWAFIQHKLILKDISANVYLNNGSVVVVKQFNLIVANHFGRYKIKADIAIDQKPPLSLQLAADLAIDPEALANVSGLIYLSGRSFQPQLWREWLDDYRFEWLRGVIDGQVWLDLVKGKLTHVQSKLDVQRVDILDKQQKSHFMTDELKANLAWQKETNGWQLSADEIQLELKGKQWPVNEFMIRFDNTAQSWEVYIQHLLLDSIFAQNMKWPKAVKPFIDAKLHGTLQETKLQFQQDKLVYALSHFTDLGWRVAKKYPGVNRLSGVLYWQPGEGRLGLDGKNTKVLLNKKPSLRFQDLNVALDWKKVDSGWQVNLERFVLRRPDLLASFMGSTIFDNTVVVAPIATSVIVPWRIADVKGFIDNSTTEQTDVLTAGLQQSQNACSHCAAAYHGKINLHGALSATNAQSWLTYLPERYLKPKLYRWLTKDIKQIDRLVTEINVDGPLEDFPFDRASEHNPLGRFEINTHVTGLDLRFAPNWPLTRDIEANLHFSQRTLTTDILHAKLQDIRVDQLSLVVNELGMDHETLLTHGQIRTTGAKALSYVLASPLAKKLPLLTLFSMKGMLDLDLKLEAPLYPENDTILTLGQLTFHDNSVVINHSLAEFELDKLSGKLTFNQDGVLPSQLQASVFHSPLSIQMQVMPKSKPGTRVEIKGSFPVAKLKEKWESPFWSSMHGTLALDSTMTIINDPGDLEQVKISSQLQGLAIDLPAPLGKTAETKSPLKVDIAFKKDHSMQLNLSYADLVLEAIKKRNGDWSTQIDQANISGNMVYQPAEKKFTAILSKLYLDKAAEDENEKQLSKIKVNDLPNLSLTIKDFRYGDWNLGEVECQALRKKFSWFMEYCKVTSSTYFMQMQGEWRQEEKINKTTAMLNVNMGDLGKTLLRWGLTPAVTAKHGEIKVNAEWPGGFQDFSLANVSGLALIVVRDGEITHLDKATEEKLGLGKLLSLGNLQTIPRRLKLDFSDLSQHGYAFDLFRGHFKLGEGVMRTSDSSIDGPVASAGIMGSIDVVHQLFDLRIKIAPHLTSSLPIVATVLGGPIVGAASWVATKIINQGMQKMSAISYTITGPWKDPVVKPVEVFKNLDKKLIGIDLL